MDKERSVISSAWLGHCRIVEHCLGFSLLFALAGLQRLSGIVSSPSRRELGVERAAAGRRHAACSRLQNADQVGVGFWPRRALGRAGEHAQVRQYCTASHAVTLPAPRRSSRYALRALK